MRYVWIVLVVLVLARYPSVCFRPGPPALPTWGGLAGAPYKAFEALYLTRTVHPLWGVVPKPWGDINPDERREEEDDYANPAEPTWLKMFPPRSKADRRSHGTVTERALQLARIDFTKLKPDDPAFLDMPWPTEAGPEASAFARHMQWRRKLADGERVRWLRWAVYARLQQQASFAQQYQYSVADYVFQQMQREMQRRAQSNALKGRFPESAAWDAIAYGFIQEEHEEVQTVVKCFYSALNRLNYDEMSTLLLPDDALEVAVPGYEKALGHLGVEQLLKRLIKESKPFGSVKLELVATYAVGFTAVVHAVETIEPGAALKIVRRGKTAAPAAMEKKRVFTTLVLRKFNKQWRICRCGYG